MTSKNNKIALNKIISSIVFIMLYIPLLLFLSGDWKWVQGWIFIIWFSIFSLTSVLYLYYKDPALLEERFKAIESENNKGWDKYIIAITIGYIIWIIIMPLDAKRFGWSPDFPLWLEILGGIGALASSFFTFRAVVDNTFVSPLIRIQNERNQKVVSTGVYGIVRHPMYLGSILMFIGVPVLLGSIYGILIGAILSLILVVRIGEEEKMLTEGLEGYADYKKKVKYRLIPFIW